MTDLTYPQRSSDDFRWEEAITHRYSPLIATTTIIIIIRTPTFGFLGTLLPLPVAVEIVTGTLFCRVGLGAIHPTKTGPSALSAQRCAAAFGGDGMEGPESEGARASWVEPG